MRNASMNYDQDLSLLKIAGYAGSGLTLAPLGRKPAKDTALSLLTRESATYGRRAGAMKKNTSSSTITPDKLEPWALCTVIAYPGRIGK
jgi:hypothetical protein